MQGNLSPPCFALPSPPNPGERIRTPPEAQTMAIPIWVSYTSLNHSQHEVYQWMKWWSQLIATVIERKCFATHKSRKALWLIFYEPFSSPCCIFFPWSWFRFLNFQKWEGNENQGYVCRIDRFKNLCCSGVYFNLPSVLLLLMNVSL